MLATLFLILRILITIVLLLFLGWSMRLVWLDLNRQAMLPIAASIPTLSLFQDDNLSRPAFQCSSTQAMVGRDPACDLILADKTVSGQHALFSYQMTQWWVEDLHSTNGTRLNQQVVSSPVVLTSGDELCFGQLVFQVQIATLDSGKTKQLTG